MDFLRQCHRRAPFLFFNGNTFTDVSRQLVAALFAELPTTRRREVMSAVAHYIAGVLDHESMSQIVDELCVSADFKPGDRVKALRGSLSGKILGYCRMGESFGVRILARNSRPCRKLC